MGMADGPVLPAVLPSPGRGEDASTARCLDPVSGRRWILNVALQRGHSMASSPFCGLLIPACTLVRQSGQVAFINCSFCCGLRPVFRRFPISPAVYRTLTTMAAHQKNQESGYSKPIQCSRRIGCGTGGQNHLVRHPITRTGFHPDKKWGPGCQYRFLFAAMGSSAHPRTLCRFDDLRIMPSGG